MGGAGWLARGWRRTTRRGPGRNRYERVSGYSAPDLGGTEGFVGVPGGPG